MRKLRIGIFTECYHPVLNGVVTSIDTFKKELESRGHKFFIFATYCPGYTGDGPDVTRFPYFIAFKPKGGRYPISAPKSSRCVARDIADLKLDLIHSQHLLQLGKMGLKVARRLDIPAILTYHTLLAEYTHYAGPLAGLARGYLIGQSRNVCNRYVQVVTPSPSMKKVLRDYGVTVPIEPIPTGVDLTLFENPLTKDELCDKWNIPKGHKILIYVSRVAKEKNVDFLFAALKPILQARDNVHFLCVGGGPKLPASRSLVKKWNIENKVTFTDMVPKADVNRLYGACDIFVFASVTETQGIVITEAMAAGIPAVAVDQMGPSDIITDGKDGYLVPLKQTDFTAKIETLLDDDNLRNSMAAHARKHAQEFSISACADQMEKLYEKVIARYRA